MPIKELPFQISNQIETQVNTQYQKDFSQQNYSIKNKSASNTIMKSQNY